MSKVLKLSAKASNSDGRFELTIFRRWHKLKLIMILLRASTLGLVNASSLKDFKFTNLRPTLVQLDGEISKVDAKSKVNITIVPRILECIV